MYIFKRTFSILFIAALSLVACTPEDGDVGPAGPAGANGANGLNGTDGTNGTNGTDGTNGTNGSNGTNGTNGTNGSANVTSNVYLVTGSSWIAGQAAISIPELTKEVAQSGAVLIYQNDTLNADSTSWRETPYRFVANVGGANTFITVSTTYSTSEVIVTATTSSNQRVSVSSNMYFKVVVIPPSSKIAGFQPRTYEEAKMVYGLED